MSQLVGKTCVRCDQRISFANDAMSCPTCGAPVHVACAAANPGDPGACGECGAPGSARSHPPAAPMQASAPGSKLAPRNRVRVIGACMVGAGLIWLVLGPRGWLINGAPVWLFGALLAAYGLWPLLFPGSVFWRRRVARLDEQRMEFERWESPGATMPTGGRPAPLRVEGDYDTPAFSVDQRPFPITGSGYMAFSSEGVEVSAFSVSFALRSVGLRAAFILVIGGILLAIIFGSLEWLLLAVVGALLAALLARALAGWLGQGNPLTLTIPWECVAGFQPSDENRVRVLVKGMKPRGAIHFRPDERESVLVALRGRGRAPQGSR